MPSYLSQRNSSRISKPSPTLRRNASSPFARAPRTKPVQRTQSVAISYDTHIKRENWEPRQDDNAKDRLATNTHAVPTLPISPPTDVLSAVHHAKITMFSPLPARAGMNSTRIAEVLNFQKSIPPVVSFAHIHALVSASSKIERQISDLLIRGEINKIKLVGRGNDVSGIGEVLILTSDLQSLLTNSNIPEDTTTRFLTTLTQNLRSTKVSTSLLPPMDIDVLIKAGFLVASHTTSTAARPQPKLTHSSSSLVSIPTISRAHSGTSAAIGGPSAFEELGGVGTSRRSSHPSHPSNPSYEMALSVPNLGVYAKLLSASRSHLLNILNKSPSKSAPISLLKERWDGAIDNDGSVSLARQKRGEFSEVLAGRTGKWKRLKGVSFEWVLEECLGGGWVEEFEGGAGEKGLRVVS